MGGTGQHGTGSTLWRDLPGEKGVIAPQFPPGRVERYGVTPDSVVVSGITVTGGSPTVVAPPGTFTSAMVGKYFSCRGSSDRALAALITARAGDGSLITLAVNAPASWSGKAVVGTAWETQYPAYVEAIYANATLPDLCIHWPPGIYNTGLNFSNKSSNTKMHFESGAILTSIMHLITTDGSIMSNVNITGTVTVCDRFGTINLQDSFIERVVVKDGTAEYGLSGARGVHIYTAAKDLEIRELLIEGCSPINGDAALAIDDNASLRVKIGRAWIKDSDVNGALIAGSGHQIGELIVGGWGFGAYTNTRQGTVAAQLCGLSIMRCPDLEIGTLRVDQQPGATLSCTTASGATTLTAASGVLAAMREGCVVTGTNIANHSLAGTVTTGGSTAITGSGFSALRAGQPVNGTGIPSGTFLQSIIDDGHAILSEKATASGTMTLTASSIVTSILSDSSFTISTAAAGSGTQTLTFTRANALYALRVRETGLTARAGKATIDTIIAREVARRGLSIGDRTTPVETTFRTILECRSIDISPAANTPLDGGWSLLSLNLGTDGAGTTRLVGTPTVRFTDTCGNDCLFGPAGAYIDIGRLDTSFATTNGVGVLGRSIQYAGSGLVAAIDHVQAGGSGSPPPIDLAGASSLHVGPITATARGPVTINGIVLDGATDCSFGPIWIAQFRAFAVHCNGLTRSQVSLTKLAATGNLGSGLRVQNCTDLTVIGGYITGFATGTTGAAGNNTRVTFMDVKATGNAVDSDLSPSGIALVGSCLNATA